MTTRISIQHTDRIGWKDIGSGCDLIGGMDLNKTTKILVGIATAVVLIAVLALAVGGSDDYDYGSQAKQEIDKYGYDSEELEFDVEKGVNALGVSIIKVEGTFLSDGTVHGFTMTTMDDHELVTLTIDDYTFWGDDMGNASYNYRVEEIGPFDYESYGYTFTESPAEGMTFALVTLAIRNVGHADGLTVSVPEFANSLGNRYTYDPSATFNHDSTYSDLMLSSVGLGNTVVYTLIYEVPEGTVEGGEPVWSNMDLDVYGYVLDETLELP